MKDKKSIGDLVGYSH